MSVSEIAPLFDPEILRTKGRGYAAYCNKISRKPYGKAIYQESIAVLAPGCLEQVTEAAGDEIAEWLKS